VPLPKIRKRKATNYLQEIIRRTPREELLASKIQELDIPLRFSVIKLEKIELFYLTRTRCGVCQLKKSHARPSLSIKMEITSPWI